MGVGAALIMPVTLSVITTAFPVEERGKAVGTWVGVAAGGGVIGLLVSGVLLHFFSWPSIFALNVALAALALAGTVAIVPATRESRPPRLDPIGTLLSVVGLAALVFGTIEGPGRGWGDPVTLAALVGGLAGIALFVLWELNRREPMLDPRNFLRRGFGAGSLSIAVQFFAAFGFLFLALPYLQLVLGYSPLQAAGALLPMAVVVIPLSRFAPRIAGRVGVRVTGPIGLGLMATGFIVFATTLGTGSSYWQFLIGLLPFGAGMALAGSPATTAIVASLPREKQGVASAMNDVSRELGGALGIAVLGSVLNTAYRTALSETAPASLPPSIADTATGSLTGAEQVSAHLGAQGHAGSSSTRRARSWSGSSAHSSPGLPRSCSEPRSSPSVPGAAPSPAPTSARSASDSPFGSRPRPDHARVDRRDRRAEQPRSRAPRGAARLPSATGSPSTTTCRHRERGDIGRRRGTSQAAPARSASARAGSCCRTTRRS